MHPLDPANRNNPYWNVPWNVKTEDIYCKFCKRKNIDPTKHLCAEAKEAGAVYMREDGSVDHDYPICNL